MNKDTDISLRDLRGEEIELLIRYRLLTDEKKSETIKIIEQLAADQESNNSNHQIEQLK